MPETKTAQALQTKKVTVPNVTANTHGAPDSPGDLAANAQGMHRKDIAHKDGKSKTLADMFYPKDAPASKSKPVGPVGPR